MILLVRIYETFCNEWVLWLVVYVKSQKIYPLKSIWVLTTVKLVFVFTTQY